MAKKTINFEGINTVAMEQIKAFAAARIAIAKEDRRFKEIIKPLNHRLEEIYKNRENDLAQGMDRDSVIRKHSSIDTENEIRKANAEHRENLKPLNADLKSTYEFIPAELYGAYIQKIKSGKRGEFLTYMEKFLGNLGIEEVTQSALRNLSERICDRLGVSVSNSKKLLDEGLLSSTLTSNQFSKLYMSVFCDILVQNDIISLGI